MLKKFKKKTQKNGYSARSFFRQEIDVLQRYLKNIKSNFITLCNEYIREMTR